MAKRFELILDKNFFENILKNEGHTFDTSIFGSLSDSFSKAFNPTNNYFIKNELVNLFGNFFHGEKSVEELVKFLKVLSPPMSINNVINLAKFSRNNIVNYIDKLNLKNIDYHDHAFGSGGDLFKTVHATTISSIIVSPLVPICKTGTKNITGKFGSEHIIDALGISLNKYNQPVVNKLLHDFGFCYIPLSHVGFNYSKNLTSARKAFWQESMNEIYSSVDEGYKWRDAIKNVAMNIDIFKIISPNLKIFNSRHHTTAVYHADLVPYVLSIYVAFNINGIIIFNYDGIDELCNASTEASPLSYNNIIIQITENKISMVEFKPEDVGIKRCFMDDIIGDKDISEINILESIFSNPSIVDDPKTDFIILNAAVLLLASEFETFNVRSNNWPNDVKKSLHQFISAFNQLEEKDILEKLKICIDVTRLLLVNNISRDNFYQLRAYLKSL